MLELVWGGIEVVPFFGGTDVFYCGYRVAWLAVVVSN
jgi:hypothetical protein